MIHSLPITDPRFLEATEEDAILDLLITAEVRASMNPDSDHHKAIIDPKFKAQLEAMRVATSKDAEIRRVIRGMMKPKPSRKTSSLAVTNGRKARARRVRP